MPKISIRGLPMGATEFVQLGTIDLEPNATPDLISKSVDQINDTLNTGINDSSNFVYYNGDWTAFTIRCNQFAAFEVVAITT